MYDGVLNMKNNNTWSVVNPNDTRWSGARIRFFVNVRAGMIYNHLIGMDEWMDVRISPIVRLWDLGL